MSHQISADLRTRAVTSESRALIAGTIAFVVTTVIGLIAFAGGDATLSGPGSIGRLTAIVGGAFAAIVFVVSYTLASREPAKVWLRGSHLPKQILDVAALAFAHAALCVMLWFIAFHVIEDAFQGAVLYWIPAALFAAAMVTVSTYFVYLSAARMDMFRLSTLLAVFLVCGGLTSMLTIEDPLWWQKNISTLGIEDNFSAAAFNVTLVVTGVIITTLASYMATELEIAAVAAGTSTRGPQLVKWGLALIGLFLIGVGTFPTDEYFALHNTFAIGMAVIYVGLVIGLPWFLPQTPKAFLALGYVFVVVITIASIFFATGYYNLTAVELIAAALIFTWLIILIRNAAAASQDNRTEVHASLDRASGQGADAAVEVAPAAYPS